MEDKILREAEAICEIMFPEDEGQQCLLHHHLALFADYVEVVAMMKFRSEIETSFSYKPDEVRHG